MEWLIELFNIILGRQKCLSIFKNKNVSKIAIIIEVIKHISHTMKFWKRVMRTYNGDEEYAYC